MYKPLKKLISHFYIAFFLAGCFNTKNKHFKFCKRYQKNAQLKFTDLIYQLTVILFKNTCNTSTVKHMLIHLFVVDVLRDLLRNFK